MIEKNQLKIQGLAFGRSLQTALKNIIMYSLEHPAAERALQQAFASLNNLVKQTQQFTFGFANHRVLLNNLLTDDSSLEHVDSEFERRDIAAVTFAVGITLREFKRTLALMATKPQVIAEKGGIQPFIDLNPIEGVRIRPVKKTEGEDTVVGMDAESFWMAQEFLGGPSGAASRSLDLLCESAGLEKPPGFTGSAGEILELAGKATQTALTDPQGDPRGLVAALGRMVEELSPEYLLSSLPPGKQTALQGRSPYEVATDLFEDMAVGTAVKQLTASAAEPQAAEVEARVGQLLFRGLKATRTAERLLQKFAVFLKEANLPAEVYDRVRQGLVWYSQSPKEKHAHLMRVEQFNAQEFQHLLSYVKEMLEEGKTEEAVQVTEHYFALLDSPNAESQGEAMARAPELLRAVAGLATLGFLRKITARLCQELSDSTRQVPRWHQHVVNCLTSTAQSVARYEDFALVHEIGSSLERSLAGNSDQHESCCGRALLHLLAPASAARLVELYIEKRDEPAWTRSVTALLEWLGPTGGDKVLQRLEEETAPPTRMALMRLLTQLGPAGMEPARRRLGDERWYVIRNACRILGDLGDPELPSQLRGALRHPDARVQQAAVTALTKSQAPDRARALAESLPHLPQHLLELTLDELTHLKDPTSVGGLEQLISLGKESKAGTAEKAVRVLAAVGSEPAAEVLGKILSNTALPMPLRKTALEALCQSPLPRSQQLLAQFASLAPSDALAREWQIASSQKP